ncbi:MAG: hypothetical protein LUG13_07325 [Oscillospiraceae bacterium]|nr:hypothetical protein [Oscillospiraceae bacterium]
MNIIQIAANESGARPAIQTWQGETPPEGYAVVDDMDLTVFYESMGFVKLAVDDAGQVTAMTANDAARASYLAAREADAAAEEPTLDALLDILLGVTEDG